MSLFLQLQVFITPRKGPFYGWHWHSEILTCGQTDSSSVVSSLQQYITTWHQLASSCWWNKHPPSHSLVGELPHAVKLFLHGFSPFSSSSWVSIYITKNLSAPHFVHPEKKKKKKLRVTSQPLWQKTAWTNSTHYTSAVLPVTLSQKTREERERKQKTKKQKHKVRWDSFQRASGSPSPRIITLPI